MQKFTEGHFAVISLVAVGKEVGYDWIIDKGEKVLVLGEPPPDFNGRSETEVACRHGVTKVLWDLVFHLVNERGRGGIIVRYLQIQEVIILNRVGFVLYRKSDTTSYPECARGITK